MRSISIPSWILHPQAMIGNVCIFKCDANSLVELTDTQRRLDECQELCRSHKTDRHKVLVSVQYCDTSSQLWGGIELVVALGAFGLTACS